jgi:hypothetical protein
MHKLPSLSSKELIQILEIYNVAFVRQGKTGHAIYSRTVNNFRYSAPIQMGKKSLDPIYCKRVFKQLGFTNSELEKIFNK